MNLETFPKQRIRIPFDDMEFAVDRWKEMCESGAFAYGEWVAKFESAWAAVTGKRHCIATGSCTQALEILVRAHRLRGRRVAVPANTYVATAQAVLHAGAFVALTDVGDDLMLDPAKLPKAPGAVDAVLAVHIGGNVSRGLPAIADYCAERNIPLLEDCAHAHGSTGEGFGSGGGAAYSFYPTKLLTVGGEGGALVTDSDEVAQYARRFRHHGRTEPGHDRMPEVVMPGHNFCMDEFRALVGWTQIRRLEQYVAARRAAARVYRESFDLVESPGTNHYKILTFDPVRGADWLPSKVYATPLHREPMFGFPAGMFPGAERVCAEHRALPVYNDIGEEEVEAICRNL